MDEPFAKGEPLAHTTGAERTLKGITSWANEISGPTGDYLSGIESVTKRGAELLGNLAKIAGLYSVLGAVVIIIYLLSSDVPLPPIQIGDIATNALPTSVLTTIAITAISALVGMPLGIKRLHRGYIDGTALNRFRDKLWAHLWCYGPAIGEALAILLLLAWVTVTRRMPAVFAWLVFATPIGTYMGFFAYGLLNRVRLPSAQNVLFSSGLLAVWLLFIYLMVSISVAGVAGVSERAYVAGAAILIVLLSFMLWQYDKPVPPVVPIILIPCMVSFLYPFSWGGFALRILGIGGDLPVSLSIKETPHGSSVAVARQVTGCLVLATSADIFLRPDVPRRDCHPKDQYETLLHQAAPTIAYHELVRYARTDVLTISEYPKIYWIDARLRGQLGLAERPSDASLPAAIQYRKERGFTKIYAVATDDEAYEEGKTKAQMSFTRVPETRDRSVPSSKSDREAFFNVAGQVKDELKNGTNIIIEGNQVHGRASFFAVCILVAKGMKPDAAVDSISTLLGRRAVDTDEQMEFLNELAERFASARKGH